MPYPSLTFPKVQTMKIVPTARLTAVTITLGMALMGLLAAYFRFRRKCNCKEEKSLDQCQNANMKNCQHCPNGDIPGHYKGRYTESPSSLLLSLQQKSLSGSNCSISGASSASTITRQTIDTSNMSPAQLCKLGFESLQQAVIYWEDGLMKLSFTEDKSKPAILDPESSGLQHQMDYLLDAAYGMIDNFERKVEKQADQFAFESAMAAFAEVDRMSAKSHDLGSLSDQESFVSATDMANLSDLETHRELFQHLPFYEAGLLELKHGNIPCRTLRTEMTHCMSDAEFLAKLHCIRLAMDEIFLQTTHKEYFRSMGKKLLGDILVRADRDPEEFFMAYDAMIEFLKVEDNWLKIEEELKGRGVKCMNFYDILLDFILMDAFDDLENPPSSVIAVIQNRWLSNGFKETALSTAVWSVLKAKRRLLKFSDGFISKFYSISEHISPVLAWGFMGPESEMKDLCNHFRDVVLGFIRDMFSFESARFTTVEELAEDIVRVLKVRVDEAAKTLSLPS